MSLHDPTPHRVSACPVHFIWDGKGHGRVLVRAAFLALLVAGALFSGAIALHSPSLRLAAVITAIAAGALWSGGQVVSAIVGRRVQARAG